MATMDERLFEAARSGDVEALDGLVNEDPFILDNLCLSSVISKTPLNVASRAGHVDFVKKIVCQKSWLAWKADKDGYTPLHLAAARGHLEVARQLLSLDRSSEAVSSDDDDNLCLKKDKEGRTPLHLSAINGEVQALYMLLQHCPRAIKEVTALNETPLHVAVKNSQFKVFKLLFEFSEKTLGYQEHEELINAKDMNGRTILDLAKSGCQLQMINYLEQRGLDEEGTLKKLNSEGDDRDETQIEIIDATCDISLHMKRIRRYQHELLDLIVARFPDLKDVESVRVFGSVIVGATYQAIVSPPASIWKEGMKLDSKCTREIWRGKGDMKSCPAFIFSLFMFSNTVGFLTAIFLIIYNRRELLTPLLVQMSLLSLTATYLLLLFAMQKSWMSIVEIIIYVSIYGFLGYTFVVPAWKVAKRGFCRKELPRASQAST